MEYLFGIIILLGALIFFHELGHFLVAKMFGVKVETFSLGFGTKIIKKKVGETEYCLSLIPLGGYVKLYGEDPTRPVKGKDAKRSFSNQAVSKRIAIAAAGPIFNVLFAILVYFGIEVAGLEKVVVPRLATVEEGSTAHQAGLRAGDKILSINNKEVEGWHRDVVGLVAKQPGQSISVEYSRGDKTHRTDVIPVAEESWNLFCEKEEVGVLKGASVRASASVVGMSDPNSWAGKAGFKTGDRIVSIEHRPIHYWYELENFFAGLKKSQDLLFKVRRGDEGVDIVLKMLPPEYTMLTDQQRDLFLGLHSYEFFVRHPFESESAGFKAGLQVGDRFISINDERIRNWDQFKEKVQEYGKEPGHFNLTYERAGAILTTKISPHGRPSSHPCEKNEQEYLMGVVIDFGDIYPPLEMKSHQETNPIKALFTATEKSMFMMYMVVKSVYKMISGDVSARSIGGPILIGKIAGDYLKKGLLPFLALLAAISINLAILNLLPIPVLDGGHLLFFFYEAIFRRRPTEKAMELANRAGLVVILALVVFAFYNDISRYWGNIVGFFKELVGLV